MLTNSIAAQERLHNLDELVYNVEKEATVLSILLDGKHVCIDFQLMIYDRFSIFRNRYLTLVQQLQQLLHLP